MAGLWAQAMTHTMSLKRRPPATKESLTLRDQRALDGPVHGRGERIQTSGLCVPNAALYQAELHPERPGAGHSLDILVYDHNIRQ